MPSHAASGALPGGAPDDRAPASADALSEVDLLLRLARRWRRLGADEVHDGGHALTPHQERALLALSRSLARADDPDAAHGVRVSRLAEQLGIAPRSATEVADALESAGLVTRSPDPTDRRAVLLTLTPEGDRRVDAVRERRRAAADAAVAVLSRKDRAELRRILLALHGADGR